MEFEREGGHINTRERLDALEERPARRTLGLAVCNERIGAANEPGQAHPMARKVRYSLFLPGIRLPEL